MACRLGLSRSGIGIDLTRRYACFVSPCLFSLRSTWTWPTTFQRLLIHAAALKTSTLRMNITKSITVFRLPAGSQCQHRQQLYFTLNVNRFFLHSGQVVFLPRTANPSSRATSRMGISRLTYFMSGIALPYRT